MNALNDAPSTTVRASPAGRYFCYSISTAFYILIAATLFRHGASTGQLLNALKLAGMATLITAFFIYLLESLRIKYGNSSFSYRSSFQRNYTDISYEMIENMHIEVTRKPFQPLDTLKISLKDGRVIKVARTAFPQPAYHDFEKILQEKSGIRIKGSSPFVAKP